MDKIYGKKKTIKISLYSCCVDSSFRQKALPSSKHAIGKGYFIAKTVYHLPEIDLFVLGRYWPLTVSLG